MKDCPDNPIIRNCERTGYPYNKEPEMPKCPICGEYCDSFYKNTENQEIVGCDYCIKIIESYFEDGD